MTSGLQVLQAVDFNWTRALRDIWSDPPYHVEELNKPTADLIIDEFRSRTADFDSNPIGKVIQGSAGAGKTHLIGALRRRVWEMGGWFVLIDIIALTDFWESAALAFVESLHQRLPGGQMQYKAVLSQVLQKLSKDPGARDAIKGRAREPLTKHKAAGLYLDMLRAFEPERWRAHQDVVRALIFLDSADADESNFAYMWLQGQNVDDEQRKKLGFLSQVSKPQEIVRGLLWFMRLGGPTMIAVDQIDAIVSDALAMEAMRASAGVDDAEFRKANSLIDALALGLIDLHDVKVRAMTVVSCLETTWPVLTRRAIAPLQGRFSEAPALQPIASAALVERLIGGRLAKAYHDTGFSPPYATWPYRREAIESAIGLRARRILMRCEDHRQACLIAGRAEECADLAGTVEPQRAPPPPPASLDAEFEQETERAAPKLFGVDAGRDAPRLVHLCELCLGQLNLPDSIDGEVKPDTSGKDPSLHASLSFVFHDEGDRQSRWSFRAVEHTHAIAFQSRLKAAMTASGIDAALPRRHLTILRSAPPPSGPVTAKLVDAFLKAGGKFVAPTERDLRVFAALIAMADRNHPEFERWLLARKPLFETSVFQAAGLAPPAFLADIAHSPSRAASAGPPQGAVSPETPLGPSSRAENPPAEAPRKRVVKAAERPAPATDLFAAPLAAAPPASAMQARPEAARPVVDAPIEPTAPPTAPPQPAAATSSIPVGRKWAPQGGVGAEVGLKLNDLRRHVLIVAGAGSGKTVVLRRMIEEAALAGLPAIVLDINNDLSRLGDIWPERPTSFTDEDSAKAAAYRDRAEVVVWTPGVATGNPISLRLLPDFAAIGAARDEETNQEREHAVEMARATLEPFVGAKGAAGALKLGVLSAALRLFAANNGGSLGDFVALLADFDPEDSPINNARKLAAGMADQLHAAIATNPLLSASGPALDIARLFEGSRGKTRISVVNLAGLASDAAKEAFVNQLQMSLFTWIKQHPSATGRLFTLDEAQNFAPSQAMTACKRSALALVQQGRKYGLGMVFATQQPRGLDNAIVSNSTTHFYGKMSAPATITATKEMMMARGGAADDLGGLKTGEFYFATEGLSRPVKLRAPLCLSYHPALPPTPEEVAAIARATRSAG